MENVHPMFVHFPIALLFASLAVEGAALVFRKPAWHLLSLGNLLLGWAGALAAVLSGRQAMATAKHSMEILEIMERHENTGYVILGLVTGVMLWRALSRDRLPIRSRWLAWLVLVAACGSMVYGAYLGGKMVYEHGVGGSYGRQSGIEVVK